MEWKGWPWRRGEKWDADYHNSTHGTYRYVDLRGDLGFTTYVLQAGLGYGGICWFYLFPKKSHIFGPVF
jgi:hypothetical protein